MTLTEIGYEGHVWSISSIIAWQPPAHPAERPCTFIFLHVCIRLLKPPSLEMSICSHTGLQKLKKRGESHQGRETETYRSSMDELEDINKHRTHIFYILITYIHCCYTDFESRNLILWSDPINHIDNGRICDGTKILHLFLPDLHVQVHVSVSALPSVEKWQTSY